MAEYSFDVQKLYLEMFLADAESFARASNIFIPKHFDGFFSGNFGEFCCVSYPHEGSLLFHFKTSLFR